MSEARPESTLPKLPGRRRLSTSIETCSPRLAVSTLVESRRKFPALQSSYDTTNPLGRNPPEGRPDHNALANADHGGDTFSAAGSRPFRVVHRGHLHGPRDLSGRGRQQHAASLLRRSALHDAEGEDGAEGGAPT